MSNDRTAPDHWDRVAAELKAYRDYQRETWGDLDNEMLGQYLAGELSGAEKKQVEAAFADHPDLLMLTELVRDVLVTPEATPVADVAVEAPPTVLSFTNARPTRSQTQRRLRRWLPLAAAACLLLGLGSMFAPPGLSQRGNSDGSRSTGLFVASLTAERERNRYSEPVSFDNPVDVVYAQGKADLPVRSMKFNESAPSVRGGTGLVASADRWQERGSHLQTEGKLSEAENEYQRAYRVRKQQLGDVNPKTIETLTSLSLLYEEVLQVNGTTTEPAATYYQVQSTPTTPNLPAPPALLPPNLPIAVAMQSDAKDRGRGWEAKKVKESQHLFAFHGQCLPPTAIPVLLDGIEQDKDLPLRERCARTLVRMGPAAQDAVPYLTARLAKCDCPVESQALAAVLADLGAAHPTVRLELEKMEKSGPTDQHKQAARQAIDRLRQPAYWAGVHDEVGLYKPETITRINARLKKLAEQHGFVLVIETVPSMPTDRDTQAKYLQAWSRDRLQRTAMPRTMHVLITQNPPATRVALDSSTDARRDDCCSPPFARALGLAIQERLKDRNRDKGLEDAVQLLELKLQDKSNR